VQMSSPCHAVALTPVSVRVVKSRMTFMMGIMLTVWVLGVGGEGSVIVAFKTSVNLSKR
jgi:hypothetical protein